MKLANGTAVIVKPYQDEDAEEIVSLIIRNFREINVKDYGEKEIEILVATHDEKWFKSLAEYTFAYSATLDDLKNDEITKKREK